VASFYHPMSESRFNQHMMNYINFVDKLSGWTISLLANVSVCFWILWDLKLNDVDMLLHFQGRPSFKMKQANISFLWYSSSKNSLVVWLSVLARIEQLFWLISSPDSVSNFRLLLGNEKLLSSNESKMVLWDTWGGSWRTCFKSWLLQLSIFDGVSSCLYDIDFLVQ